MPRKTSPLLPATESLLMAFGDRLRLARFRRKLTAAQVAERAGMVPMTLRNLERGSVGVTIGAYLAVMQVLGVEEDLNLLLKDDPYGRQLQDAKLLPGKPASRKSRAKKTLPNEVSDPRPFNHDEPDAQSGWADEDFLSAESLALLLSSDEKTDKDKKKRTKK
ncbi:helix-turn-helix domain-containing protein [Rahnella sikkimica]|uniref:DNA-binding protein n=1 Tax=Rahnella sikkimica TaxID=1805933 RepID=A0A2L1UTL9_9GAMM|nr:helix-turn-helix transcriptional regulator [Rahnella sikkimica]AVF36271.1 DNA-binding protein [Rahnella sikkimica]